MGTLDNQEDIKGMALISVGISLLLLIATSFANYANANKDNPENILGTTSQEVWNEINGNNVITRNIQNYTPDNLTCPPGTTDCTESVRSSSSLENTGFDPIQAIINIGRIIKIMLQVIALTALAPIYITWYLGTLFNDSFINLILIIFGMVWQIANVWLIAKLFTQK